MSRYTVAIEFPGAPPRISHFDTIAAAAKAAGTTPATARAWMRKNDGYQPGDALRRVRITTDKPLPKKTAKPAQQAKSGSAFCIIGWLVAIVAVLLYFV